MVRDGLAESYDMVALSHFYLKIKVSVTVLMNFPLAHHLLDVHHSQIF